MQPFLHRSRRLLALAFAASLAGACAHGPATGGYSRFVKGNVPDYDGAWKELNRPPDESLQHFIARVRRLAASTRPSKAIVPSLEGTDPVLRDSLAALALSPSPANHWRVAEAYRRSGVLDLAHDHLRSSVRLDPRFAPGWDGLARVWRDWDAPGYALADASRAVYFAPEEAAYRNTLGTVLQALGRWSEARAAYEAARERAPGASWVLNNLCALDLATGRPAEARSACEAALAADPGLQAARGNLARATEALRHPTPGVTAAAADGPSRAAAGGADAVPR
jgi:tetratricopeptide (TPR) repeat protein